MKAGANIRIHTVTCPGVNGPDVLATIGKRLPLRTLAGHFNLEHILILRRIRRVLFCFICNFMLFGFTIWFVFHDKAGKRDK